MRLARIALLLGLIALGSAAVACGDDDGGGTPAGGNTPARASTSASTPQRTAAATPQRTTPATTETGGAVKLNVTAQNISYSPTTLAARSGVPVTITLDNKDQVPHTLTVYADEGFTQQLADTGRVSGGSTGQLSVTFDDTGDKYFRCNVHPTQMQGEITIE